MTKCERQKERLDARAFKVWDSVWNMTVSLHTCDKQACSEPQNLPTGT